MNRIDLQNLANERIAEAKILLDAGKWSGAYYLAGYAVECGLKACIANLLKTENFPEKEFSHKTQAEAQALYDAITQHPDGVLPWIQRHW
jgi:hypothetical protein